MIVKDKLQKAAVGVRQQAGNQQEQDVAFYFRRAFKDEDRVRVFHDLQLCYDSEYAQIDHLIVYTFGFIVIESKSIKGEVRVNAQAEWSRSYRQQWQGMPSPIKQAELQLRVLQDVLTNNDSKMLGKILGLVQQGLGGRKYHVLCAISSDAIINRSKAPKEVAVKLVKTEFIADALKDLMRLPRILPTALRVFDSRPAFNAEELDSICSFLLTEHLKLKPEEQDLVRVVKRQPTSSSSADVETLSVWQVAEKPKVVVTEPVKTATSDAATLVNGLCKHCQSWDQLSVHAGRYGYYLKCHVCQKNTALKQPCTQCHSQQTKVRKESDKYQVQCESCGFGWRVL